ncbi:hypothetical protein TNCV_3914001 [Trichonephila clavipes]|nr:hypothetical protein TNCV_3914001 [Trichonephila clavipes]
MSAEIVWNKCNITDIKPEIKNVGNRIKEQFVPWQIFLWSCGCLMRQRGNESSLISHYKATRGLLVMKLLILNLGQVTRTTPELEYTSPNCLRQDSKHYRFIVHHSTFHCGSSVASGLEPVTRRSRVCDHNY